MAYDYISHDGLVRSNDPSFVTLWNDIAGRQQRERSKWRDDMRRLGAKAVAPDDGWVNRTNNELAIADYADFGSVLQTGDLMALGGPDTWRLVRITGSRDNPFLPGASGRIYAFEAATPHA